ncbi:MAG: hypothetical protein QM479_07825 [Pseudomonadota bacterium]
MPIKNIKTAKNINAYQHIFLLSHMRANTSLISHILGSHTDINGYYEMHLSYLEAADLDKQQHEYCIKNALKQDSKYLFDKILHNAYALELTNLTATQIKILVSIRPAEQTIKSIINLFAQKKTQHSYADVENASQYYIQRIKQLAEFCKSNRDGYYYFDADIIRTSPEKILKAMQQWLSLSTPLTEQYQIFSQTGKPRAGDSSVNMKQGEIVKQQSSYADIEISEQLLQQVLATTQENKQFIKNYAIESLTI